MPSPKNVEVVQELTEKFQRAEVAVMFDYRGLNAKETQDLRFEARKAGIELRVGKNRLIKLALKGSGCEALDDILKDPTMVAFGFSDVVTAPKVISAYVKKNDKLKLKGGLCEKKALDAEGVTLLATLPSKEELLARLAGSISPQNLLGRMLRSVRNPLTKLARGLSEVAKTKSA